MLPGSGTTELSASPEQNQPNAAQVPEPGPNRNGDQEVNLDWHSCLRGKSSVTQVV